MQDGNFLSHVFFKEQTDPEHYGSVSMRNDIDKLPKSRRPIHVTVYYYHVAMKRSMNSNIIVYRIPTLTQRVI